MATVAFAAKQGYAYYLLHSRGEPKFEGRARGSYLYRALESETIYVLVVHHEKDGCNVTRYSSAKSLAKKHNFKLVTITGGGTTGEVCGPFHYHGFENKMPEVIQAVHSWSSTLK